MERKVTDEEERNSKLAGELASVNETLLYIETTKIYNLEMDIKAREQRIQTLEEEILNKKE